MEPMKARAPRMRMSAVAGAGLTASILAGLAAGWVTVSAMDAGKGAGEPTRPWRHVESSAPADPLPQQPASVYASWGPAFAGDGSLRPTRPEPVMAPYDLRDTKADAETRRLDAKLDALIRQGERDARRAAEQLQIPSLAPESEPSKPGAGRISSAPTPSDNPPPVEAPQRAADQATAPVT